MARRLGLSLLVVVLGSAALAQGTYFRKADGKWEALKVTATGPATKFTLSPDMVGGASTVIVLNKPAWMVLEDEAPPMVMKALLDGKERPVAELDLGWTPTPPTELVLAIKDDKNPLDLGGLSVTLDNAVVDGKRLEVKRLTPDNKQARVAVKLAGLPQGRHELVVLAADMAPSHNLLRIAATFNTAPLVVNGSFEESDKQNAPVNWVPGAWSSDAATKYECDVRPGGAVGAKALRFLGIAGSLNLVCSQETRDLKSDVTYVYTGQYKSEGGCSISVISSQDGKQLDYLSQGFPAAKEWTPFTWEFKLVQPHNSAMVVVRTGSKGETWFDDIKVLPKPEQETAPAGAKP